MEYKLDVFKEVKTADCLLNPLLQGAFQLFIEIDDRDPNGDDQQVDVIFVETSITPGLAFTNTVTHIGENNFSRLELSFRVTCSENFYGPNCTTFCTPMDSVQGHYTCDQDGGIVCNPGYTNTSTNCVECLPAEGCCEFTYISCVVIADKTQYNQSILSWQ